VIFEITFIRKRLRYDKPLICKYTITGNPIIKVLTNIDSNEIFVESEFGNSTFNIEVNPVPTSIAKSSENSTRPNAILMLLFLSKSIN